MATSPNIVYETPEGEMKNRDTMAMAWFIWDNNADLYPTIGWF